MLLANNFTAIAIKITPKIFLIIPIPDFPKTLSILSENLIPRVRGSKFVAFEILFHALHF